MNLVFASNYLQHHQVPLCRALHGLLPNKYTFIQTCQPTDEYLSHGYSLTKGEPYQIDAFESEEAYSRAYQIAVNSDVLIHAYLPEDVVAQRMKAGRLTFRFNERLYKRGRFRVCSPRGLYYMYLNHTRYRHSPLYMLCASAYTAGDYSLVGAYRGKCYKWGYFTGVPAVDVEELILYKANDVQQILWCARFLEWKHPEKALKVAETLKADGMKFRLTMIGNGPLLEPMKKQAVDKKLDDVVQFIGSIPASEVVAYMARTRIFLFTSDFQEGWGVVLNEAMSNACAVVASHAIGSVPYLLKHDVNGLIYQNSDVGDLVRQVRKLVDHPQLTDTFGRRAYLTIKDEFNASIAAERFVITCEDLLSGGRGKVFKGGIMSNDGWLSNNWFRGVSR